MNDPVDKSEQQARVAQSLMRPLEKHCSVINA